MAARVCLAVNIFVDFSGFKADAGAFFTFVLLVLLTGYSAVGIALFFSATFGNFSVASIFITLTFIFSIVSFPL